MNPITRAVRPWLQGVNADLFPFKDPLDARINGFVMKYFSGLDANGGAFAAMLAVNFFLGSAQDGVEALAVLYGKERLKWRHAPVDLPLADYSRADYEAVADDMAPLEAIIRQTPPERNGLRWRYVDGSVLFEFSRLLDAPFDEFAARVDISRSSSR
jgi:hypothetical protein